MSDPAAAARLAALGAFVEQAGPGRWLVLTHDNPDPDALASAHVMAKVLRGAFGLEATPAYGGIIGRAENREMVRSLHLKLSHVRHLELSRFRHFALVDTQPRTGNNQLPAGLTPDLVLDHHPRRKASQGVPLADVRPEYGATATIAAEYLVASRLRITAPDATALVYAIRTETRDFGREASGPDHRMHDLLLPRVNKRSLARMQHPRLPLSYFRTLHQALERLEGVDSLVLCHLDEVEAPDIVPEIADLLLRLEGKTWSLCTGHFEDRIYLSLRTTNTRAEAGNLMRRLVGRRGRGGGHGMTAGGWMTAASNGDRPRQQRRLGESLARALRKNPDRLAPLALGRDAGATAESSP